MDLINKRMEYKDLSMLANLMMLFTQKPLMFEMSMNAGQDLPKNEFKILLELKEVRYR